MTGFADRSGPDPDPTVAGVHVNPTMVLMHLSDGRLVGAPVRWFPRLANASPKQRANWQISGGGYGVHWPDVDEDISVRALMGRPT